MWIAIAAAVFYLLATRLLVKRMFDSVGAADAAVRLGLFAAFLHAVLHAALWWQAGSADLHFFAALSLVTLGMAMLTGWFGPRQRLDALGVVVFPLAALAVLVLAFIERAGAPPEEALGWQIGLHAWTALLAYATLALAALLAVLLWLQERALRKRHFAHWLRALPPLTQLETLLFRSIAAGFALLTLTLVTGALFVDDLLAQHLVHKTVLSILSWLLFGALLWGRRRYGWRGRRAVRLTLTAMALLFLAFFGSQLVLELILHRTP